MRENRVFQGKFFPTGEAVNAAACMDEVIPRVFGHRRNAAKILARMSGASERTAKNWLARKHSPGADHMARLMAECLEVEQEVLRLVALIRDGKA